MEERLKRIVFYVTYCENQLNQYVPNSHIAITFCEVLEFVRYYNNPRIRKLVFDDLNTKYKTSHIFESAFEEVFNLPNINKETVHQSYQELRIKENSLRNLLKLAMISYGEILMPLRVKYGMFDIFKKEFNSLPEFNKKVLICIVNNDLGKISVNEISLIIQKPVFVVRRACNGLVRIGAINKDETESYYSINKNNLYEKTL